MQEAGILNMTTEPTTRKHGSGDTYADTDFVARIEDPVEAIVQLADYRAEKQRKPYTRQEPCPHCKEVHSRTRRTYCDGCGKETARPEHIPVPPAQREDITDEQRRDLDERTAASGNMAEVVDYSTGEIMSGETGSTNFVEAEPETQPDAMLESMPVDMWKQSTADVDVLNVCVIAVYRHPTSFGAPRASKMPNVATMSIGGRWHDGSHRLPEHRLLL